MALKYSFNQIWGILKKKGYIFYEHGMYNANIIGVRSATSKSNDFDDLLYCIYKDEHQTWITKEYPVTTDPGKSWLLNPLKGTDGVAIMVPGQYHGAYMVGKHGRSRPGGGYEALEQNGNISYVRDDNHDSTVDFGLYSDPKNIFSANLKSNIHRGNPGWFRSLGRKFFVDKYSAGCQVFEYVDDFLEFMGICKTSMKMHGNSFTYTLIEEKEF